MKSLLKYLSPFAPDLAGAVSVFFELDGLLVICDAGGCTGNICGFDEPRWFTAKSALFSAGLRDMDAILGRDRQLADKLIAAAAHGNRKFAAMIGSPVPAVIATDFTALKRMCEKKLDIPVLAIEVSGTLNYEVGASQAYCELFKTFAVQKRPVKAGAVGVLGVTPLDFSTLAAGKLIKDSLSGDVRVYGMGATLDDVINASEVEKNIVTAPSALKCARYLERVFGTPYEIAVPWLPENVVEQALKADCRKILIVHDLYAAGAMRRKLQDAVPDCQVTVGSFFTKCDKPELPGDVALDSEADFKRFFEENQFDLVIADQAFERIVRPIYHGQWIDWGHFAVSGRIIE